MRIDVEHVLGEDLRVHVVLVPRRWHCIGDEHGLLDVHLAARRARDC